MNRLSKERSAYLRHASHQKINWYSWSDEPFNKAESEGKPLFLSSGAVWCHWCHVMAKESFEDTAVADILNKEYICIKLDRDERPDVDRRYQQAVMAMGYGSGWPLSVFLTHEKKPFYGGTYFPPDDSFGRPGFIKVLQTVAEFYSNKKDDLYDYTGKILDHLKSTSSPPGELNRKSIDDAVSRVIAEFDPENGGFGKSPKFPMPGAIGLLINRFFFTKDSSIADIVKKTLTGMASGGFHDQLGGGFHRYSVDESWSIPHFEKMSDDNAWLLRNYADAYALFGDDIFRKTAEGSADYILKTLSDPEGGYYASQDADVSPDDEGGYFIWHEDEFREVLDEDEFKVLSLYYLGEFGSMPHDRSKRVLYISASPEDIADKIGFSIDKVQSLINTGVTKLLNKRELREMPYIDKAIYASVNGMMAASFLNAFKALNRDDLKEHALKTLDRVIASHYRNGELDHIEGVKAMLDDYIHMTDALLSAYEVTASKRYISYAVELMDICIDRLWDDEEGGLFDSEESLLDIHIKGVDDIPHPSSNSIALIQLIKLHEITGDEKYMEYAKKSLEHFINAAEEMGIHSSHFFSALDASFNLLKLTVNNTPGSRIGRAVLKMFHPYSVFHYESGKGGIVPCIGKVCYEPIITPGGLTKFLKTISVN